MKKLTKVKVVDSEVLDTVERAGGRVVFIRAPRRMSEEELRAALGGLEDGAPAWMAVNQLLDEELAAAVLDASDGNLVPGRGTYPGGKIAALAELKDRLHRCRSEVVRK